jgi:hypothetical protein
MLCASRERAAHRSRKEMLWEGRGHEMPTLIFRLDTCSLEAEMRARAHYETVVSVLTLLNKRGGRREEEATLFSSQVFTNTMRVLFVRAAGCLHPSSLRMCASRARNSVSLLYRHESTHTDAHVRATLQLLTRKEHQRVSVAEVQPGGVIAAVHIGKKNTSEEKDQVN